MTLIGKPYRGLLQMAADQELETRNESRSLDFALGMTSLQEWSGGFYETAGCSQGYSSLTGFASTVHSSRCFYPHSGEPQWARCILVSDDDEWVLLSEGRPLRAKPLVAVTTTRDGNESGNVFKIRFEYLFLVMVCC